MVLISIIIPIIIFVIAILIIIYIIKKEEEKQKLNEKRYEELTNKFLTTIDKIYDENNRVMKNLTESIRYAMEKLNEEKRYK